MSLAVLTRSERGSVVLTGAERHEVAAVPTRVVDTTGADRIRTFAIAEITMIGDLLFGRR